MRDAAARQRAAVDESSSAPVQPPNDAIEDEEAPPRLQFTRAQPARARRLPGRLDRRAVLPAAADRRPRGHLAPDRGRQPDWMFLALLFTVGMFGGYVMMFRGVFVRAPGGERIGWRESYQITMAGLAASRLFAAGGAGGLVLTAWALRRAGMRKRMVADTTLSFLVLTYFPYVVALIVCGLGLRLGLFPGEAPFGAHRRAGRRWPVIALASASRSRSCRPTSSAGSAAGRARGGRLARIAAEARPPARLGVGRHARRARARALARPGAARRGPLLGLPDPRPVGGVPRVRRRAAARPCSCRRSSSACSATCCRCRAASAASRAA